MSRSPENYGNGGCAKFWEPYSVRDGHSQPGNPKANSELSPAKAKEILRDGTVHGKAITKKQRGYFGAVAGGKAKK